MKSQLCRGQARLTGRIAGNRQAAADDDERENAFKPWPRKSFRELVRRGALA